MCSYWNHPLTVYSGLMTAARLKALGVDSIIVNRDARVGANWSRHYDSLKFHVPTSNCEMPYARKTLHTLQHP
jgi:cation diffusion facilitator CzcD-associated flavoprotein CzcO